jgi:hypothetical protein
MLRGGAQRLVIVAALVAGAGDGPGAARADRSPDEIGRVLDAKRHRRAFQRCFTRELRSSAFALADRYLKLVVRFTIDEAGRVRQLRVERETTPALDACMIGALRRVRFPATGKRVVVRHPFIFG